MSKQTRNAPGKQAMRLLDLLAADRAIPAASENDAKALIGANLATRAAGGRLAISDVGRAHLARLKSSRAQPDLDPFLGQHASIVRRGTGENGCETVLVNEAESPLAWLARRKGRDGRPMIEPHQFLAGERLRADFTRAQMSPRTTSNWESPVSRSRRGAGVAMNFSDAAIAARQRINRAMAAAGPEFSGLLFDVCCFLKGLEHVERERKWPPRSGKVVLQLALECLARHYGLAAETRGKPRAPLLSWNAHETAVQAE